MSYASPSLLWPFEGVAWPATFLPVVMSTTGTFAHFVPVMPFTVTVPFAMKAVALRLAAFTVDAVSKASLALPPQQTASIGLVAR